MSQNKHQKTSDVLLVLGLFFLSSVSSFFHIFWLNPGYVFVQAVVWLILAALCVWMLRKHHSTSEFHEQLKRNWMLLPFLIFSGASIFWSIFWEISLYRWLILFCTIIAGGYIGLRYEMKRIMELLSIFGMYILVLSCIVVFMLPDIGVMNYHSIQGAWKGMYWHKNHMGLMAAFFNMLYLINIVQALQSREKTIPIWVMLYFFSLLFVVRSDSAAALMITIFLHAMVLFVLFLLKFRANLRGPHYLLMLLALIFVSVVIYLNIDLVFGIFNRNTTLTGRIPMWANLFDNYFSKRPFLGYGFNAFWYVDSHRVAIGEAARYPDPIVIADNGFIDILMNTGYIGLILFSIFYFGAWWQSVKYAGTAQRINGFFPVFLMSYTLLANISWSLVFENESFFMLIMASVLFCITNSSTINREG